MTVPWRMMSENSEWFWRWTRRKKKKEWIIYSISLRQQWQQLCGIRTCYMLLWFFFGGTIQHYVTAYTYCVWLLLNFTNVHWIENHNKRFFFHINILKYIKKKHEYRHHINTQKHTHKHWFVIVLRKLDSRKARHKKKKKVWWCRHKTYDLCNGM